MFWTTEHFQCAGCAKPQKYLLSFELVCHCLAHNQCFEQGNTSSVATDKSVCQALNHCLAHIELVHSLFSTTSPTRQLPAVRSLLCLVEMDLMKNEEKKQSWRPRWWLCRLLPELQMCKFHAWSDSGKTHIHHSATRTPMYSMINNHPHYEHFDNCFVTLSRVCVRWSALLSWFWRTSNPPTRQNESGVQFYSTQSHTI